MLKKPWLTREMIESISLATGLPTETLTVYGGGFIAFMLLSIFVRILIKVGLIIGLLVLLGYAAKHFVAN